MVVDVVVPLYLFTAGVSAQRMAAKLRPRVKLPRLVSSTAVALLKPAAVSFSGVLGSDLSR
jgi:hypothetical protein